MSNDAPRPPWHAGEESLLILRWAAEGEFDGLIDHLALYSGVLTSAEVEAGYLATRHQRGVNWARPLH